MAVQTYAGFDPEDHKKELVYRRYIRQDRSLRRLSNRLLVQDKLIAEVYYLDDIEAVRARIRNFFYNSDKTDRAHRRKKAANG